MKCGTHSSHSRGNTKDSISVQTLMIASLMLKGMKHLIYGRHSIQKLMTTEIPRLDNRGSVSTTLYYNNI